MQAGVKVILKWHRHSRRLRRFRHAETQAGM